MSFYAKNQMVWAKIQGYPWWPAIVVKSNQTKNGTIEEEVLVNFIGENSHAIVELDRIVDFDENYKQHSASKSKKLADSIKIAQMILDRIITYPEVRKRLELKSAKQVLDELEEEKERRKAKLEKKKESETKDSPKKSLLTKKIKEKEVKAAKEFENLFQYMLPTFTRSHTKKEHIEMLTEPLIYSQRKGSKSSRKDSITSLISTDEKEDVKIVIEPTKANKDSSEKKKSKRHSIVKTSTKSLVKEFKEKIRTLGKTPSSKLKIENEKEKEIRKRKPTKLSKNNRGREKSFKSIGKNDENELELDEMTHDMAEESEDYGNVKVTIETSFESEAKAANKKRSKRLRIDSEDNFLSPKYSTKSKKKGMETEESEREHIVKKVKTDSVSEENLPSTKISKPEKESISENNEAKAVKAYQNLKIKKIENDLEKILNKFSGRFLKKEELVEGDEDLVQLVELIKELESNKFGGSELVGSNLGKLFRTIHFLFVKNKDLLSKTGNTLITALAQVLHNIKNKIIQHCLDITNLMEALQLPHYLEEELPQETEIFAPINFGEVKVKLEEPNPQNVCQFVALDIENNIPITAKIEEDMSHKAPMKVFVPSPSETEDTLPPGSYFCKMEHETETRQVVNNNAYSHAEQTQRQELTASQQIENFELRRKICQKFALLLQKVYSIEREKAQELTLLIEDKIYTCYANVNDYKHAIKGFLKLVKANKFNAKELVQFQNMRPDDFTHILNQNFSTLSTTKTPEKKHHSRNNTSVKKEHTDEQLPLLFKKGPLCSRKETSSFMEPNMLAHMDNMYNINVKQEEEGVFNTVLRVPTQSLFQ